MLNYFSLEGSSVGCVEMYTG